MTHPAPLHFHAFKAMDVSSPFQSQCTVPGDGVVDVTSEWEVEVETHPLRTGFG